MNRKPITWISFYNDMKDYFCEHITIDTEKEERFFINNYFVCHKCFKKILFYSNPKNLRNREIGIKTQFY